MTPEERIDALSRAALTPAPSTSHTPTWTEIRAAGPHGIRRLYAFTCTCGSRSPWYESREDAKAAHEGHTVSWDHPMCACGSGDHEPCACQTRAA